VTSPGVRCLESPLLALAVCANCALGPGDDAYVIPGPTAPAYVSTHVPFTWETRGELDVWVNNSVSRGPISLIGEGAAAVIRIDVDRFAANGVSWVLRGPDFDPPLQGVRGLKIRYSYTPALRGTTLPVTGPDIAAAFDVTTSSPYRSRFEQATAHDDIGSAHQGELLLRPCCEPTPIDVRYAYLHSEGGNRGVLEIDAIAVVF
jgi:hypothetical protein